MITLAGIALPDDIQWTDEFGFSPVSQIVTPTITGALIVEEDTLQAGRPFTLASGDDGAWITRATVKTLKAKVDMAGQMYPLIWSDGVTYNVMFDRRNGAPFDAQPVVRIAPGEAADGDFYTVTLRLITV